MSNFQKFSVAFFLGLAPLQAAFARMPELGEFPRDVAFKMTDSVDPWPVALVGVSLIVIRTVWTASQKR